jgi:hypothetical protein
MANHAPEPLRIIRTLTVQVSSLCFSFDNERLYAADIQGSVIMLSTRTFRPIESWTAHEGGVLGVEEWYTGANEHRVITLV